MQYLIAFVGAAIIALVLWKAMNSARTTAPQPPRRPTAGPTRPRASGPDDDPEFLRKLAETVRKRDDPPTPLS